MAGPWEKYAAQEAGPWSKYAAQTESAAPADDRPPLMRNMQNLVAGAVRGAGSIGATILAPIDIASDALAGKGLTLESNRQRRADMDAALSSLGADTNSLAYGGGKLLTEVAGTLGTGGFVANALGRAGVVAPNALQAIRTAGMNAGTASGKTALALRTGGGAGTGAASAFWVNPEDADTGALFGGALPGAVKAAGAVGRVIGAGARTAGRAVAGNVTPEVAALADRAKALGINIPADRLVNSKPMNAVAASLNYMPLSGRAGTEDAMLRSMNRALSRTFGQDSDNVTAALRKAQDDLGSKFDAVLQGNKVQMTPAFKTALADAETQSNSELGPEAGAIIRSQIAQIQTKGAAGAIDGQAAYNIKKALDRIGRGNSDAAFYARDLKQKLMTALNESLGPQEAEAFSKVRQQYGNMLALENMAQNGAEGGISVGRLANMKSINNSELQELADIAAQFLRTRESPHGALQRLVIGGTAATTAAGMGTLSMLPAAVGAGRGVNAILNSEAARNAVLGVTGSPNAMQRLLSNPDLAQLGYRTAPVLAGGR